MQRVRTAAVEVAGQTVGRIDAGLLVLLGVAAEDGEADADYLVEKVINLRVFEDDAGKMNRSLTEAGGALLVVSQFTLLGDVRRGRRPSYTAAAPPERASALYEYFVAQARRAGVSVATGVFQAMMEVSLINSGPVTILLDSKKLF